MRYLRSIVALRPYHAGDFIQHTAQRVFHRCDSPNAVYRNGNVFAKHVVHRGEEITVDFRGHDDVEKKCTTCHSMVKSDMTRTCFVLTR